jgi:hypothetical protein
MRILFLSLALLVVAVALTACTSNDAEGTAVPSAVGTAAVDSAAQTLECVEPDETDLAWIAVYAGGPTLSDARVNVGDVSVNSRKGPVPVPDTHVLSYVVLEREALASFALVCSPSDAISTTFVPLPLESAEFSCEKWAGTESRDSDWDPIVAAGVQKAEECAIEAAGPGN